MKFCIAAKCGNNSKISLEPQREGDRREAVEGLLETKKSAIKLSSWRIFCHTENCSNYQNWCDRKIVTKIRFDSRFSVGKVSCWMDWFINRCRNQGIWIDIIVVRFLPLSFYAKKKVAERKARIRGGGAKDARIREHMAAPVPPLMYLPLWLLSR